MNHIAPVERAQLGNAVLYRADARDFLAGLPEVDVILTDPVWPNCPPGPLPGSDDPYGLWRAAMVALPPIQRLVTVLRADCDPRFLATVPETLPFFNAIQPHTSCPTILAGLWVATNSPTGSARR